MSDSTPLRILIADDSNTDRLLLQTIIKKQGHEPVVACDGQEAIDLFEQQRPDIILLDALMPNVDGFGAARYIKANMGDDLIPIIFLTSLNEADSLAQCLDAGGDDFLSKPYHPVILSAKIQAFRRMQSMHKIVQKQRDQIYLSNQRLIQEQEVAKRTFDKIAHEGALQAKNIEYSMSPMAIFNGDVLLAAIHPNGDLCVLLGDFTGHGLAAAIGAMPLAQTFYSMIAKGFSIRHVAREINKKLKEILPVGVFCCAAMLQMNFHQGTIEVFNAAMPDIYILDHRANTLTASASKHLALGILSDAKFDDSTVVVPMSVGDEVFLYSDGVIESQSESGEMYGSQRLTQLLNETLLNSGDLSSAGGILSAISKSLGSFRVGDALDDDLSMLIVRMVSPDTFAENNKQVGIAHSVKPMRWSFNYKLENESLRYSDPTPVLQKLLSDAPMFSTQMSSIYTVLSELFANALEHGVLGLDSSMKSEKGGFQLYYQERTQRLNALKDGYVSFEIAYSANKETQRLSLKVTDSGKGFEVGHWLAKNHEAQSTDVLSGRGLSLVQALSDDLLFSDNGRSVEAVFLA